MRSTADSTDLPHLQKIQGTTEENCISTDDLLALRALFLLLDAWDRNRKPATPVDTRTESAQGERHAFAVSARPKRAA
jgi:hypothetical protein